MFLISIGIGLALCAVLTVLAVRSGAGAGQRGWFLAWIAANGGVFLAFYASDLVGGAVALALNFFTQIAAASICPLLFLYVVSVTGVVGRVHLLLAFGSYLSLVLNALPVLLFPATSVQGAMVVEIGDAFWVPLMPPLALIIQSLYPISALRRLRVLRSGLKKRIKESYLKALDWMEVWAWGTLVLLVALLSIYIFSLAGALTLPAHIMLLVSAYCGLIAYVCYHGVFKEHTLDPNSWKELPDSAAIMGAEEDYQRLCRVLIEDDLVSSSDLTAPVVAEHLGWSDQRLSEAFTYGGQTSFSALVTAQRIDLMQSFVMDKSNESVSLLGLAYDAGFGSKTAFYKAIKHHTGLTPAAWRKKITSDN